MMKSIIILICLISTMRVFAGNCTSISRVNNSANEVLTSTKYNSDNNTAYAAINAADGGCIVDATLEKAALGSDFVNITEAGAQGCLVSRTNVSTLSVDKCYLSVNGNWVRTTSATSVTWGCDGCATESASTLYYLYVKTGSTGTTMNLLISTTQPNGDGYDVSGNRVIAKFYNDASQNISTGVNQWSVNGFIENSTVVFTHEVASGAGGGTFTSGAWQTRPLTNTYGDSSIGELSSNQITLLAGVYRIEALGSTHATGIHAMRLRNITNSVTIIGGPRASSPATSVGVPGTLLGVFTITATTVFEVQHYCSLTGTTTGFGFPLTSGEAEVYASVSITRLSSD